MHLNELFQPLTEAIAVGSAPANIVDLRDSSKSKRRRYVRDPKYVKPGEPKFGYFDAPTTMVALTANNGAILYFFGHENIIPWREVLDRVHAEQDKTLQANEIITHRNGFLIDRDYDTGKWTGDRNQYSDDVRRIAQALLDRGLASETTPLWLGNWAGARGQSIGSIGKLLAKSASISRIVVYHGTSSLRLPQIMKDGLRPLALEHRVWNKGGLEKQRPAHRDECVYVTASRAQAEYYSRQAVKIDRVRMGPSARVKAHRAESNAKDVITRATNRIKWIETLDAKQKAAQDSHAKKYGDRFTLPLDQEVPFLKKQIEAATAILDKIQWVLQVEHDGPVKPVLLTITLTKKDLGKLMADDDFLRLNPDAKPEDWLASLQKFSQIAYKGIIPPNQIKIIGANT